MAFCDPRFDAPIESGKHEILGDALQAGTPMTDTVENLILDLIEWVGRRERTYQETMDAWRTSCPKLPVWEDANDRGLVELVAANGRSVVRVTPVGLALLEEKRPYSFEEQHRTAALT
jgi:hypothetical protein